MLATALLISDVLTNRKSVTNFFKAFLFSKLIVGGNNMSAPIYWQNHSLFLGQARQIKFANFSGGSPDVAYSKIT